MNSVYSLWNHLNTSFAGLLMVVFTVAASALAGLFARDAAVSASERLSKSARRVSAWMLIGLLVPLPWIEGCSGTTVAHDIVNWTPSLQSAVATIDSTAALLAPADAPVFSAATAGFDVASTLLVTQAKAYLANPGAGTLAQLQTQVVTFEQQVNAALLQAGKIVNPASQQHALAAIQAVATIVAAILVLVRSVSSKSAIAHMAADSGIKLAAVQPFLNRMQAADLVAAHYNEPITLARLQVAQAERAQIKAGF